MKVRSIVKKVRHQAGVTILEFIAFVGLAALVIAGALSLYGSGSAGASANDLISTANGVVASLRATYPNGKDLTTAPGLAANLSASGAPAGWTTWTAGGVLQKGARTITVAQGTAGTFNLTISTGAGTGNEQALCNQIAAANQPVGGRTNPTATCNGTANSIAYNGISLP